MIPREHDPDACPPGTPGHDGSCACCELGRRRFLAGLSVLGTAAMAGPLLGTAARAAVQVPQVSVTPLNARPAFDRSKDIPWLGRLMASGQSNLSHGAAGHVVGVTSATFVFRYNISLTARRFYDRVQGYPRAIELAYGTRDVTVYIAREMSESQCAYDAVETHELKHVAVDHELVQTQGALLKERVNRIATQMTLLEASSSEALLEKFETQLNAGLTDLWAKFSSQRVDAQAKIDTPAEYARTAVVCGGVIPRIIVQHGH